jgi:hypothetical protein
LTIVREFAQPSVPTVVSGDLVLLQRLAPEAATLAGRVLGLSPSSTQFLQVMADDMVTMVQDGRERYVWFAYSDIERQFGGAPRR